MRVSNTLLQLSLAWSAAVYAMPFLPKYHSSTRDISPRYPLTLLGGLTLTSPPSTNSSVSSSSDLWPIICYQELGQRLVNFNICQPLIHRLASEPDFRVAKIYSQGIGTLWWANAGCTIFIQYGKCDSLFSMLDVIVEVESILNRCQPTVDPFFGGTGGQAPINSPPKYESEAFVVQVVGGI